jgi:hypothetical protein
MGPPISRSVPENVRVFLNDNHCNGNSQSTVQQDQHKISRLDSFAALGQSHSFIQPIFFEQSISTPECTAAPSNCKGSCKSLKSSHQQLQMPFQTCPSQSRKVLRDLEAIVPCNGSYTSLSFESTSESPVSEQLAGIQSSGMKSHRQLDTHRSFFGGDAAKVRFIKFGHDRPRLLVAVVGYIEGSPTTASIGSPSSIAKSQNGCGGSHSGSPCCDTSSEQVKPIS